MPIPSPDAKGGGLCTGPVTQPRKTHRSYRNYYYTQVLITRIFLDPREHNEWAAGMLETSTRRQAQVVRERALDYWESARQDRQDYLRRSDDHHNIEGLL